MDSNTLNILHIMPGLQLLDQLRKINGIQFRFPPNSLTKLRFRVGDFNGNPLLNPVAYKIKSFYTERGSKKS